MNELFRGCIVFSSHEEMVQYIRDHDTYKRCGYVSLGTILFIDSLNIAFSNRAAYEKWLALGKPLDAQLSLF